jgi:hypothetical protein
MWNRRAAAVGGLGLALALAGALGAGVLVEVGTNSPRSSGAVSAILPEGRLVAECVWLIRSDEFALAAIGFTFPKWAAFAISLLVAAALALGKYVTPVLIGSAVARSRRGRNDTEFAAAGLPASTVVAGVFWAAAWPALTLALIALGLGACVHIHPPQSVGFYEGYPESAVWAPCTVVVAAAVALAAAIASRRPHYTAPLALGAAWVTESLMRTGFLMGMLYVPSYHIYWSASCAPAVLRLIVAAAAFWLAARLWRRASAA